MTPTFKKKILSYFHVQNFDMLVFQQFSHISSELKPQKRHNTENEPDTATCYLLPFTQKEIQVFKSYQTTRCKYNNITFSFPCNWISDVNGVLLGYWWEILKKFYIMDKQITQNM